MSTFPAADLIVDVARAADPRRQDAAMRRLSEAATTAGADTFATLANAPATRTTSEPQQWRAVGIGVRGAHSLLPAAPVLTASASNPAAEAIKKFESLVLQTFFETMLPKGEDGLYGHGVGGDVWRSMIAQQFSDRFASAGAIGLNRLFERQIGREENAHAIRPSKFS